MCYDLLIARFCETFQRYLRKQSNEYNEPMAKYKEQIQARRNEARIRGGFPKVAGLYSPSRGREGAWFAA